LCLSVCVVVMVMVFALDDVYGCASWCVHVVECASMMVV
jgi:hypothetical protein